MSNILHMRTLVLGLARSGRAAVAALRRRSGRRRVRRAPDVDVAGIDAEVHLGEWDDALLDGVELVVKSPGVPGMPRRSSPPAPRGVSVISEIELGARLLPNPIVGDDRDERQDDDDGAARRDLRRGRPARGGRRATSAGR